MYNILGHLSSNNFNLIVNLRLGDLQFLLLATLTVARRCMVPLKIIYIFIMIKLVLVDGYNFVADLVKISGDMSSNSKCSPWTLNSPKALKDANLSRRR